MIGVLELDRTAVAHDPIAGAGHQLSLRVDLQRAVAGVALAARGLHHQKSVTVDGNIERIAGLADRPGVEIVPGGAVLDVAQPPVGSLEAAGVRDRHQKFFEDGAVGLVAGGVQIGDVVGDDLELAVERDLSRQSDQEGVLHRPCSLKRRRAPRFPSRCGRLSSRRLSQALGSGECLAERVPDEKVE